MDSALEKAGFEAQHAAAGEDGESIEPPGKRPPVPSKRGRSFGKLASVESTAETDVEEQPALPPSRMVLKSSSVKGTIDIGAVEAIIKEQYHIRFSAIKNILKFFCHLLIIPKVSILTVRIFL